MTKVVVATLAHVGAAAALLADPVTVERDQPLVECKPICVELLVSISLRNSRHQFLARRALIVPHDVRQIARPKSKTQNLLRLVTPSDPNPLLVLF